MNQLVFVKNDQVVTDSLNISEVFGKRHSDVLRDVRDLGCSEDFRQRNFAESSYINSQNKEMPMYYMNKKGFTLLVMGYTGKEAMKFKEAYINEFERMENELRAPRILSEKEQLMASMKLTIETAEELTTVKSEVKEIRTMVEQQITLDHGEQRKVQKSIAQRVYELAEQIEHPQLVFNSRDQIEVDVRQEVSRYFRELHREIKDRFGVASYKDIKRKDLQSAINYINNWIPRKVVVS
ncbi:Rha family phage regulatory protein [Bacillus oleivorans]|uniref:Rha family phage regulatory protein n=1 Tax=Bacillus oleivorans TaxID=1448271 RepID=A0A285CXW2_9BACI|nr:Rha family transcriptional regulator [Bacillus oleivorans]SNX71773.1 Rha family phage regulatory protein [Bacillus oleivorans]